MRIFLALVTLTFCVASRVVLEPDYDCTFVPAGANVLGTAPTDDVIELHFAMKQQNLDQLHTLFHAVSDPRSEQYGEYLTWDDVERLVAPSLASQVQLTSWIRLHGGTEFRKSGTGDWLVAKMSIGDAQTLLQTTFSTIQLQSGRSVYRALEHYSVPEEISRLVDFVGGVHGFAALTSHSALTSRATSQEITPDVIKSMTQSTGVVGSASNNSQAVAQFLEQYYAPSDLSTFQQQYNLIVMNVSEVDGPNDPTAPGLEATLDIEYVMAMGQNIVTWFVSTAGRHRGEEPFLTWIQDMEADSNAPWIHSVSYGDPETTISTDYAERCDVEFQKFGVTGRTIFFASGDDGVGCKLGSCLEGSPHVLVPNWPASSPSVTSVGGMYLDEGGNLVGHSISSGGFSNIFSQPSYQSAAVSAYLSTATLPDVVYNSSGRAIPDISAFSDNVQIVYNGRTRGIGGTSCAAPTVAGLFALLNDLRLQNNMATLGFLNPLIYQIAASDSTAFTDVTSGKNTDKCCTGFSASNGWDPITGWGLPNYKVLSSYVLNN